MSKSPFEPKNQNAQIDAKITAGMEKLSAVFRVLLWEHAKQLSLSPIQIQLLIFLQYHGSEYATVSSLAAEFSLTKATISDAVKVLEQKKLVKKIADPADARSYCLELTAAGKKIVATTDHYTAPFQEILAQISAAEKELLWKTISGLIYQLNQLNLITVQRMCFSCKHFESSRGKSYCTLLNTVLKTADIRMDCPEHQTATVV